MCKVSHMTSGYSVVGLSLNIMITPFDANDFHCINPDGQGYPLDAIPKVCPTCRGSGRVSAFKDQC